MSYRFVLIGFLLLLGVWGYTDITMLNCPAQFNLDEFNTTTDTTV